MSTTATPAFPELTPDEREFVRRAHRVLEHPGWLARASGALGRPVERGLALLPEAAREGVARASQRGLEAALRAALTTLGTNRPPDTPARSGRASRVWHGLGAAFSGTVGGFFGLPGALAEVPVTTTILLRSIASVARDCGEDLADPAIQFECLEVFALGGAREKGSTADSAYFSARFGMAGMIREAAAFTAGKTATQVLRGLELGASPALARFAATIAARYEILLGEKAALQLIPGIGAATGALLNVAFHEHFHEIARCHFGLKRLERELERKWGSAGPACLQDYYKSLG